jgi:hypothetical protein
MQNIDFIKQPWLKLERFILHLCYLAIRKYKKSNPYPKNIKKDRKLTTSQRRKKK